MSEKSEKVLALADGVRSSVEIAKLVGLSPRYVRRIVKNHDAPRLGEGAQPGASNHQYKTGRAINHNGYATLFGRAYKFEHRHVMEQKLGRLLLETERVDHIDGLTLHNNQDNLRVFASNAEHLTATLTGKIPLWSGAGYQNMLLRHHQPSNLQRVDIHRQRTEAGAVRLRQILLTALRLGIDSPYLLGTNHHTEKAQIDMSSRSTIQRALDDLCELWGFPPLP